MYLYYLFYIVESVFEMTNPYIYDMKNFNINIGNPMDTEHISLKTFENVNCIYLQSQPRLTFRLTFSVNNTSCVFHMHKESYVILS